MKPTAEETVQTVTDFLNCFSSMESPFIQQMNGQHRTLQQAFTKLCFAWIENCAEENYRHDLRNEASHKISKELIQKFLENNYNFPPSKNIPFI
jgi:hypothetical protein